MTDSAVVSQTDSLQACAGNDNVNWTSVLWDSDSRNCMKWKTGVGLVQTSHPDTYGAISKLGPKLPLKPLQPVPSHVKPMPPPDDTTGTTGGSTNGSYYWEFGAAGTVVDGTTRLPVKTTAASLEECAGAACDNGEYSAVTWNSKSKICLRGDGNAIVPAPLPNSYGALLRKRVSRN